MKSIDRESFCGKEQNIMYVPNVSIPKPQNVLKIGKTFSATKSDLHVESSLGVSKVPIVTSRVLEEVVDVDASSLENTWFLLSATAQRR
jgi:hypothetical protein